MIKIKRSTERSHHILIEKENLSETYPGVTVGITGLRENFVRDGGIEEPYWGPSKNYEVNLVMKYNLDVKTTT